MVNAKLTTRNLRARTGPHKRYAYARHITATRPELVSHAPYEMGYPAVVRMRHVRRIMVRLNMM